MAMEMVAVLVFPVVAIAAASGIGAGCEALLEASSRTNKNNTSDDVE